MTDRKKTEVPDEILNQPKTFIVLYNDPNTYFRKKNLKRQGKFRDYIIFCFQLPFFNDMATLEPSFATRI